MATIDNLVIEISANTTDAESKIKGLSSALNSLKKASSIKGEKLEKVADGFKAIKRACSGIKESTISKVERLADALERVGNANVGNISRALRNFEAKVPKTSAEKTRADFHPPAIRDDTFKAPEIIKQLPAMYEDTFKEVQTKMNALVPTWEKVEPFDTKPEENAGSWRELGESVSYAGNEMKKTITYSFNLGKALGVVGKIVTDSALTTIALPFKALGKAIKNLIAPINSFIRSIGRIALYRAIRSAIKGISQGFKEGLENLAMFSKLRNELDTHSANKVLSEYTSNFLYFKNALATAVIPILKMLQPVISAVTMRMIDLINVFAQFFSFLSGSDTYTKAKYVYQDYADSIDKASKSAEKLNKQLAKFDEINNLTTKDADDSEKNYLEMFEDPVPIADWIKNLKEMDFKSFGQTIADKIKTSLSNINWAEVYGKSMKLGKDFASFLNGLIDPETFGTLGKTLAGGIMTAIKFAFAFGEDFDWENLGNSIAEGINSFFAEFDGGELGDTVRVWIDGVEETFKTAVKKIKWKEVFKDLFDFFSHLGIDNILLVLGAVTVIKGLQWGVTVGQAVINGIITAISSQIGTITLGKLTIDSASKLSLTNLGASIGEIILTGLAGYLIGNRLMQIVGLIKGALTGDFSDYELYKNADPISSFDDKFNKWSPTAKGGQLIGTLIGKSSPFQSALKKGKINEKSTFWEMGKAMGEEIILGIVAGIGTKIKTIISFPVVLTTFLEAFKTTFDSHSPAKTMYPIGEDIILGIIQGFTLVNFGQKMTDWFNTNVAPWFQYDRWYNLAVSIRNGISNRWTETANDWNTKTNNLMKDASDKLSNSRWYQLAVGMKDGVVNRANELYNNVREKVSSILTNAQNTLSYNAFYTIGSKIGEGLKKPFSTAISSMESLWDDLKKTISAGITSTVTLNVDSSALSSYYGQTVNNTVKAQNIATSLSSSFDSSVNGTYTSSGGIIGGVHTKGGTTIADLPADIRKRLYGYANGGYPIRGDLFIANESGAELVGNINGRTGVANNQEITEAIYMASYNGMSKALAENGMNVTIEGDTNKIFRVVRKDAREFYNQNGFSPFPV